MEGRKRGFAMASGTARCILIGALFSVLSALLYSFMLGLIAIPFVSIMSLRMVPVTLADIAFMPIISIGVGVSAAVYVYRSQRVRSACDKKVFTGSAGAMVGFITSACPLCNLLFFSLLGASFTLAFLYPFVFELRILSLVLMFASSFMMMRDVKMSKLARKA